MRFSGGLVLRQGGMRLFQPVDRHAVGLAHGQAAMQVLELRMRGGQLLGVLVGGLAQLLLDEGNPLLYRAVVGFPGLALRSQPRMRGLQRLELLEVLLRGTPDGDLQVVHALAQRRAVGFSGGLVVRQAGMGLLQIADHRRLPFALGHALGELVELRLGLGPFAVGLVAELLHDLLQILHPLRDGLVVGVMLRLAAHKVLVRLLHRVESTHAGLASG
mmetsp:Transcript_51792/g.150584  ORF Transcript_51792/g.150584 Transcript_51792/m.150584 type:complete len:217 (+) Transcript_51792:2696-3346(+)